MPCRYLFKLIALMCLVTLLCPACREEDGVVELQAPSGDVTLYVRAAGGPDPEAALIAIGGGPGYSSHYLTDLDRLAGPEMAVVTYDQRGMGRSSNPSPYATNYDLMDYVQDLDAVRKAVRMKKVHLLGHYWGAMVALKYASLYPENVGSIVIYGAAPPTVEWAVHFSIQMEERLKKLIETGVIDLEDLTRDSPEWFREVLRAYFSSPDFWFSAIERGEPPEGNDNVNRLTFQAMGAFDLREDFAKVSHPVLILFGEDDPGGRPLAQATVDALSNADVELIIMEKCGHFWQEQPEEFYRRVAAFLNPILSP